MIMSAAIICIPINKSLVCKTVPGSSIGPPNETRKAVPVMDKKGDNVALGATLASEAYRKVASMAERKVTRMTIKTDIGCVTVGGSVNGIKYCSPRTFDK